MPSHVQHTITQLRPLFSRVDLVTGNGFKAWRHALQLENTDHLNTFDWVTLMDDSCLGPLFDMQTVIEKMEKEGTDFWGMTKRRNSGILGCLQKSKDGGYMEGPFLSFSRKAVASAAFREFWGMAGEKTRDYSRCPQPERTLHRMLTRAGLRGRALSDAAARHPDKLIRHGVPFVKISAFRGFPHPPYLRQLIETESAYPLNVLEKYLGSTYPPDVTISLFNKSLILDPGAAEHTPRIRTAIHIHAFYADVFEKIFRRFARLNLAADLFITTDQPEKKDQILAIIKEAGNARLACEVILCENHGRDILPWLGLAEKLQEYQVAGHFHTKKTGWSAEWIGSSWLEDILGHLVDPATEIIGCFEKDPGLGIVIPDIPYCHRFKPEAETWAGNRKIFRGLWRRMNIPKPLEIKKTGTPVMPFGNMFWYRPQALQPLYALNLGPGDFPPEPMPVDNTIAHALERMPVYIAWSQGYDYRIAVNREKAFSAFDYKMGYDRLGEIYYSVWRLTGRILAVITGKIQRLLKSLKR